MVNKKLTLKEKTTTKQFVLGVTKAFQKLQNCEDYQSIKDTILNIEEIVDNKKWGTNFRNLCKQIDVQLNLEE